MTLTTNTTVTDLQRNWPYRFQDVSPSADVHDFLLAFAQEYQSIDVFLDELYEQRYVQTSTGLELEKLAATVGISRREAETDEALRFRTEVGRGVATSNGTPKDMAAIMEIAFGDKDLGAIDVSPATGTPVLEFSIPSTYLDDIPLTKDEFEQELREAMPCGTNVTVFAGETFRFNHTGSEGLSQGDLI